MYKVFVNRKIIYLASEAAETATGNTVRTYRYESPRTINEAFTTLINLRDVQHLLIWHEDVEFLWEQFRKQFMVISAAGGMVKNEKGEYLFIHRYGKWDLPKGKIESGESEKEAAIREVNEECGLVNISITGTLPVTCHIYELDGNFVLKLTYWFSMTVSGNQKVKPQKEEGITSVRWFSHDDVYRIALKNTYPSVMELVRAALPPRPAVTV